MKDFKIFRKKRKVRAAKKFASDGRKGRGVGAMVALSETLGCSPSLN